MSEMGENRTENCNAQSQHNGVILQIGAGGVGGVVTHKMAINRKESLKKAGFKNLDSIKNGVEGGGVFSRIILASRTLSKCQAIADSIRAKGLGEIEVDEVNADEVESVVQIIEKYRPTLVINVALPYQDLAIMEACLRTRTHYLDTANYEHPDTAHFEYKEQWAYDTRYKQAGIFALLGSGFDPGVTNVFCAYAQKHYFDEIFSVDILDCNAGDHGYAFATNFNPEINLREVSSKARYWIRSDSSLGNHFADLADFEGSQTSSLASPPKSAKNHESNTANTRIVDSSLDSATSADSKDSTRGRILDEKLPQREAANEAHLVVRRSEADLRRGNLSLKANAHSTSLESNLALNPDLQKDTIYRKFEREEKHFKLESNTQNLENKDYCNGQWRDVAPLSLMKEWDYIGVGVKNSYLLYHEELESLIRNIRGLRRIRFFMTFGESYLTHMKVLENVGLLRIDEVEHNGGKIVPLEVLKTLLPDPASLASRTKGQTHIGCFMQGVKDGKPRTIYIYNICDHEKCYEEVNAQGVSYTTGVPAMIGAKLICEGKWGVGAIKAPFVSDSSLGNHLQGHSACGDFSGSASSRFVNEGSTSISSLASHNPENSLTILECQEAHNRPSSLTSQNSTKTAHSHTAKQGEAAVSLVNTRIVLESSSDSTTDSPSLADSTPPAPNARGWAESTNKSVDCHADKSARNDDISRHTERSEVSKNSLDLESYNKARLALNKDMPKGAEFQGIDNGTELANSSLGNIDADLESNATNPSAKKPTRKAEFQGAGVWNMEQNNPDPFMFELNQQGLPYIVLEILEDGTHKILEDGRKHNSDSKD